MLQGSDVSVTRLGRSGVWLGKQFGEGLEDGVDGDLGHADGVFAAAFGAGSAGDVGGDYLAVRASGAVECGVFGSEEAYEGFPQCPCKLKRAGVGGDEGFASSYERGQVAKGG